MKKLNVARMTEYLSIVYMICSIRFRDLVTYLRRVVYKLHLTTIARKIKVNNLLRKQSTHLERF